jgi:hypothetical protein
MTDAEKVLTAVHEAGHAWAYRDLGKPLRYVTIRPRTPGAVGLCKPWKPRRLTGWLMPLIAAAGPIAEAMHRWAKRPDDDLEWDDYLSDAVFDGGRDDLSRSLGLLDNEDFVSTMRASLDRDWPAIERLARVLVAKGTVSGATAFATLAIGDAA